MALLLSILIGWIFHEALNNLCLHFLFDYTHRVHLECLAFSFILKHHIYDLEY